MVGDPEWLNSYMEGVSDTLNSLLAGLAFGFGMLPTPNTQEPCYVRKGVLSMVKINYE